MCSVFPCIYNCNHAVVIILFQIANAQDYEVSDIDCSFGDVSVETNSRINQLLAATLKKPENFKGAPIFADDRGVNPLTDPVCQIRPIDENENIFNLTINDLDKCGVLVKNVSHLKCT